MAIATSTALAIGAVATAAGGAYVANKSSQAAKSGARAQANAIKTDAQSAAFIAEEQTRQLDKEIAFQREQAEKDREIQLQAVEASKFLAEQGLAIEEKALEETAKAAKLQAEAIKEQARATDSASANNFSASILGKPDLKQLAFPALIGVYLYYKMR